MLHLVVIVGSASLSCLKDRGAQIARISLFMLTSFTAEATLRQKAVRFIQIYPDVLIFSRSHMSGYHENV